MILDMKPFYCFALLLGGFSAQGEGVSLKALKSPAWSLHHSPKELVVSVSPTRQTLQLLGSAGLVIGSSVSAVVDDKYRVKVNELLGDYDAGEQFESRLKASLEEAMGTSLTQVSPLVGMGSAKSVHEAREVRFAELTKAGHEVVLDLVITYGIFGSDGMLVTKIEGALFQLPKGRDIWRNSIVCSPLPVLADERGGDPTDRFTPSFGTKLGIEDGALEKWLQDDGTILKTRFEASVDGALSALLCDLKLADSAEGHYYLGKAALAEGDEEGAQAHFSQALALDAGNMDYGCALSVANAHLGKVGEAMAQAQALLAQSPGYGPAHYNLAWWYMREAKDAQKAAEHYKKAQALGMPSNRKIEKFLKKNS